MRSKAKTTARLLDEKERRKLYQAKIEFFTHLAHENPDATHTDQRPMEKVIRKSDEVPLIQKNLRIMERNIPAGCWS